ncbi:MAG: TIGR02444 family protein [Gammaproteobacteria bacterium]|nr:TIGR02444 family protein [Gammaproteobacteria bacterium]MBU1489019.1 TIGR02444 family protein [Gammaproteobacteria bacterium]MBU2065715.1 TIGR02444 family protein [Gammaproteobacteria bacterium]MBU2139061.1 TIGR02444 family protein [Gammaproteobacteria bacterium]MBU2217614.1 TIGR02444 family protein [Gammaproteobacteria bacterium]
MQPDLWPFAENLYQRPGVEAACLHLQSRGADVCLLLCAAWLQQRNLACTPARVAQLRDCAHGWQKEVVGPLRALRQRWKMGALQDAELGVLRETVKRLELDAERLQLQRLAACSQGWSDDQEGSSGAWIQALAPDDLTAADQQALTDLNAAALS